MEKEKHRGLLGELMDLGPGPLTDAGCARIDLEGRYGFARKPAYVRMRMFGHTLDLPRGVTEVTLRVDEAAALIPKAKTVFVVENEITYLAFPTLEGTIVLFGGGYDLT